MKPRTGVTSGSKLKEYDWDAQDSEDDAVVVAKDRFKQKGADAKMMAGFEVLGKYYVDKGMTINFHKGFQDLNPKYLEKRHQRATKLANKWMEKIKDSVANKV